ncbi:hypothetical protein FRB90_011555, partial [Tulasnella sp. 427]
ESVNSRYGWFPPAISVQTRALIDYDYHLVPSSPIVATHALQILLVKKTLRKCLVTPAKRLPTLAPEVLRLARVEEVAFLEAMNMPWNPTPTGGQNPAFSQEIPSRLRDSLIETFLQNRDKCCFDLHVGRFIASLSLPSEDLRGPHPALVQSILLMGSYFSRAPALVDYEVRFLAQSRQELSASLSDADRLHDYVRASNLVAFFYFCKGMYAEAYQQIGNSARMVVTCGLHQIPSGVWHPATQPEGTDQFISHPVDSVDLGERIHTFWQTVTLDRMIAMVVGQLAHLPNGPHADPNFRVTTPWPRLIHEYESGNIGNDENNSIIQLFDPRLSGYFRPDTLYGLRAQGLCLAQYAFHLSHTSTAPQEIALLDNAINVFMSRLPGLRNGGESGEIAPTPGLSPVNHKLVLIRTLPCLASLIICQHGADPIARQRVGAATQGIAAAISELSDTDFSELFLGLGHLWFIACEILTNIYHHSQGTVRDQISRDLNGVLRALKKLSLVYPLLGFQVQELEQKLAAGPVS